MEKEIGIDKFLRESHAKLFEAYSAMIAQGENPLDYEVIGELSGQAISDAGVTLVKRVYLRKKRG